MTAYLCAQETASLVGRKFNFQITFFRDSEMQIFPPKTLSECDAAISSGLELLPFVKPRIGMSVLIAKCICR